MKNIQTQDQLPDYIRIIRSKREGDAELVFINKLNEEGAIILELEVGQIALLTTTVFRKNDFALYQELLDQLNEASFIRIDEYSVSEDLLGILAQKSRAGVDKTAEGGSKSEKSFIDLIREAYEMKASDIHIIRTADEAEIKFRIDGRLRDQNPWTTLRADNVIPVAYNTLGINKEIKWDLGRYQDTDMLVGFTSNERLVQVKLRYTHSPAKDENTWKATLRVLDQSVQALDIRKLGYSNKQADTIERMLLKHTGLIILAGTTGAGKSTTATSLLSRMYHDENGEIMIHTVEDPPEYTMPRGVVQTPLLKVKDKSDPDDVNFFAKAVRNIMRQDPDVIFIGELRDAATAEAAVHAVKSGHKVVSTIHASDSFSVVSRLEQLGIDRETLCDPTFFGGIIYQKLLPVLDETKFQIKADDEGVMSQFFKPSQMAILKDLLPKYGLEYISTKNTEEGTGYKGRTLAAEVLDPNHVILSMWRKGEIAESMRYWREELGGQFAIDHAMDKVREGIVCPGDALAVYSEGVLE
jgi:type II secretory ATPase GspE/PulE/Tfp pilus assembly ATPase PilB-like protein